MSRRKISRQQRWRIEKVQAERAERAKRRDVKLDTDVSEGDLGPLQPGLIVSHFGQQVEVEGDDGRRQRCHVRSHLDGLVTGDRVAWHAGNPTGVVSAREERRSLLSRPDSFGKLKPVAANIDHIVIVVAPQPEAHPNLIDRYLVAAEHLGIPPLLLLNKFDLLDDDHPLQAMLERYRRIGYPVVTASTKVDHGLDTLKVTLRDQITIFVGQSGVGKSSLINVLLPGTDARVGALSDAAAKGRHTTTTARLFHFPEGGSLIDSPGIREFGLWNLDPDAITQGFIEFRPFIGLCRFRDCRHELEPGCALLQAIEDGKIDRQRVASYRQILNSLDS